MGEQQDAIEDKRHVPFAQVETCVLRDPTLSMQAKALYGLLISYGPDRIFPGQERLAMETGSTARTVRRWLYELRDHELITWQRRGSTSNLYTIIGPAYVNGTPVSEQTGQECPNRPDIDVPRSRSRYLDSPILEDLKGAGAPIVTFTDWQQRITKAKNWPAELQKMCKALYPGLDPPDYSYIGRVAKKVGGAGRLADLLWQHSTRPPTGDLLAYIQGVAKRATGPPGGDGRTPAQIAADIAREIEAKEANGG